MFVKANLHSTPENRKIGLVDEVRSDHGVGSIVLSAISTQQNMTSDESVTSLAVRT